MVCNYVNTSDERIALQAHLPVIRVELQSELN